MKKTLEQWAGARKLNLTLLFTDIVGSTAIGQKKGDEKWIQCLTEHFQKGRELSQKYDCYVVKVIGDAFMLAFRTSSEAVQFAIEFSENTGNEIIGIRIGIHAGEVQIMDNDIYGLNVNKTARIQSSVSLEGIKMSSVVKDDFLRIYGKITGLSFIPTKKELKNFGEVELWMAMSHNLRTSYRKTRIKRQAEIGFAVQTAPKSISSVPLLKTVQQSQQPSTGLSGLLSRLPPIEVVPVTEKKPYLGMKVPPIDGFKK